MREYEGQSFLASLFEKLSNVIDIGRQTGTDTTRAQEEVLRQIKQACQGNPITGEGVTKSGREDFY